MDLPDPGTTLTPPSSTFVQDLVGSLEVCFENIGDAVGYVPVIDLWIPDAITVAGPVEAVGSPGLPVTTSQTNINTPGGCAQHRLLTGKFDDDDDSEICAPPGEAGSFYHFRLPLSSFGPAQTEVCLDVPITAEPGFTPDDFTLASRGIFLFGTMPNRDFTNDPPIVQDGSIDNPQNWNSVQEVTTGNIAIEFESGDFSADEFFEEGTVSTTGIACGNFPDGFSYTGDIIVCLPDGTSLSAPENLNAVSRETGNPLPFTKSPATGLDMNNCFTASVFNLMEPFCVDFEYELDDPETVFGSGNVPPPPGPGDPPSPPIIPSNFDFSVTFDGQLEDPDGNIIVVDDNRAIGNAFLPYSFRKNGELSTDTNGDGFFGPGDVVGYTIAFDLGLAIPLLSMVADDTLPNGVTFQPTPVTLSITDNSTPPVTFANLDMSAFATAQPKDANTGRTDVQFDIYNAVISQPGVANLTGPVMGQFSYFAQVDPAYSGDDAGLIFAPQDCLINQAALDMQVETNGETTEIIIPDDSSLRRPSGTLEMNIHALDNVVCSPYPCSAEDSIPEGTLVTYRYLYEVNSTTFQDAKFQVAFPAPQFALSAPFSLGSAPGVFVDNQVQPGVITNWPVPFNTWTVDTELSANTVSVNAGSDSNTVITARSVELFFTTTQTFAPALDQSPVVVLGTVEYNNQYACERPPVSFSGFPAGTPLLCIQSGAVAVERAPRTQKTVNAGLSGCDAPRTTATPINPAIEGPDAFNYLNVTENSVACDVNDLQADDCFDYVVTITNVGSDIAFAINANLFNVPAGLLGPFDENVYLGSDPTTNLAGTGLLSVDETGNANVTSIEQEEVLVYRATFCASNATRGEVVSNLQARLLEFYSSADPSVTSEEDNNFVPLLSDEAVFDNTCLAARTISINGEEAVTCELDIEVEKKCPSLASSTDAEIGDLITINSTIAFPANSYPGAYARLFFGLNTGLANVNFDIQAVEVNATGFSQINDPITPSFGSIISTSSGAAFRTILFPLGNVIVNTNDTALIEFGVIARVDSNPTSDVTHTFRVDIVDGATAANAATVASNSQTRADQAQGFDSRNFAIVDASGTENVLELNAVEMSGGAQPGECILQFEEPDTLCDDLLDVTPTISVFPTVQESDDFIFVPLGSPVTPPTGQEVIEYAMTVDVATNEISLTFSFQDEARLQAAILDGSLGLNGDDFDLLTSFSAQITFASNCYSTPISVSASPCNLRLEVPYVAGTVWSELGTPDGELQEDDDYEQVHEGVVVKLVDPATGDVYQTTTTNSTGDYFFYVLPDLPYELVIMEMDAPEHAITGDTLANLTITNPGEVGTDNDATHNLGDEEFVISIPPLDSDGFNIDNDFGFVAEQFMIGDYVWFDLNQDGLQGDPATETPFPGVTVSLTHPNGTVLATTTTNMDGFYFFDSYAVDGLIAGVENYIVSIDYINEPTLAQYELTQGNAGMDDTIDSDAMTNGTSHSVIMFDAPSTGDDLTLDFGYSVQQLRIGNYVWYDFDLDGMQGMMSIETPFENIEVTLRGPDGSVIGTTLTDAMGQYIFSSDDFPALLPETSGYTVSIVPPEGFQPTSPNVVGSDALDSDGIFNATSGEMVIEVPLTPQGNSEDLTFDFGLVPVEFAIGDTIFLDTNRDGLQDAGDEGIVGVTLELFDTVLMQVLDTTVTGADGFYLFNSTLSPGMLANQTNRYEVRVDLTQPVLDGLEVTDSFVGMDETIDSGLTTTAPPYAVIPVTLTPSTGVDPTYDGGFQVIPFTIGDYVWFDYDLDGVQGTSANEQALEGIEVTLRDENGTVIATTLTDASGLYQFSSDEYPAMQADTPGYTVSITPPPTLVGVANNQGTDDALDSDAVPTAGELVITFTTPSPGGEDQTLDFGLVQSEFLIGDRVWFDENRDGLQTDGEANFDGIEVQLIDANTQDVLATTTTNMDGLYFFNSSEIPGFLPNATDAYLVTIPFGQLDDYQLTDGNIGTDDSLDSDATNVPADMRDEILVGLTPITGEDLTFDFGYQEIPIRVGDYVWYDRDQDNTQAGATDEPLAGVVVNLEYPNGTVIATTATDPTGFYFFDSEDIPLLRANQDFVVAIRDSDNQLGINVLDLVDDNEGMDDTVDSDAVEEINGSSRDNVIAFTAPAPGGEDLTLDFGFRNAEFLIGDYVWLDTNGDGIQDATDIPVTGTVVTLSFANGTAIATTATDANGLYEFNARFIDELVPGGVDYVITVPTPAGTTETDPFEDLDTTVDSNAVPSGTAGVSQLTYTSPALAEDDLTLDFGFVADGDSRIGDRVWFDDNDDGLQDNGEIGVSDFPLYLVDADGNILASTTTDDDGLYFFETATIDGFNPLQQNYSIVVLVSDLPAGTSFTTPNNPTDLTDGIDSDATNFNGTAFAILDVVGPPAGEENLTYDIGIRNTNEGEAVVGNFVWVDENADGIQDPSEPGIPGVLVSLYTETGTLLATTTTDASGLYQFSTDDITGFDPNSGDYVISVDATGLPISNLLVSPVGAGGDSALDSNGIYNPDRQAFETTFTVGGVNTADLTYDFGFSPCNCGDAENKCLMGVLDPVTYECTLMQADCDDGDPCTSDICDPSIGCRSSPIIAPGCPLSPVPEPGPALPVCTAGFATRLKSFGNTGSNEVYIGISDIGTSGNRNEAAKTWTVGQNYTFTYTYDNLADVQSINVDGGPSAFQYTNALANLDASGVCGNNTLSRLQLNIANRDTGTTVSVFGLTVTVDGTVYGPVNYANVVGNNFIPFGPFPGDFASGFTITGQLFIDGPFPSTSGDERSKLELTICCDEPPEVEPVRCLETADCLNAFPEPGCAFECIAFECVNQDNDKNCDDSNPCTQDQCLAGICTYTDEELFTPCVGKDHCRGECFADAECVCVPPDCNDNDECTADAWDPDQHVCVNVPVVCDDQNACTVDTCISPTGCDHQPVSCDDQNACTVDYCDVNQGCLNHPLVCEPLDRCHVASCVERPGVMGEPPLVGACEQQPIDCDDGDRCTLDTCDGSLGCRSTSIDGCRECESASDCDDNDVCTSETCTDGFCFYGPGTTCEDASEDENLCINKVCHPTHGCIDQVKDCANDQKVNVYGGVTYTALPGDKAGVDAIRAPACEVGMCMPETGECQIMPLNCTTTDACKISYCDQSMNKCMHHERQCVPSNECMEAKCDSVLGCVETPLLVTPPNACQLAQCVPGTGIVYTDRVCDDGDPCTVDTCSPHTGCQHVLMNCKDEDACTTNERCEAGVCVSDQLVCESDPNNLCEEPVCHPQDGCGVREKFCPPSPSLQYEAKCDPLNGECVNVFKDCDDLNPCTEDRVRPNGDCTHDLIPGCCNENDDCPLSNKCINWSCNLDTNTCEEASSLNCCAADSDCDDGLACTNDFCQTETGTCFNNPVECETPIDLCLENVCLEANNGTCVIRSKTCNDRDACTNDYCEPSTGKCVNELLASAKCSDGNKCTTDTCDHVTGECVFTPCQCDDGNLCTVNDCNPVTGECFYDPVDVDDEDACTVDSCDRGTGQIVHEPVDCDDGCPCTIDTCNKVKGCIHTPVDYSNMTAGNICLEATCDPLTGAPVVKPIPNCCRANDECHSRGATCTEEYCDYNTNRCVFRPKQNCCGVDRDCNDNNKCTTDTCKVETGECCHEPIECVAPDAGSTAVCYPDRGCVIEPVDCMDDDPCTVDSVMLLNNGTEFMCLNEPLECEQPEDACAPANVCFKGECVSSEIFPCDDNDPCTEDECTPSKVFKFQADKVQCTHKPCDCRDTDPCTVDTCDKETGQCIHVRNPFADCCTADSDCDDFNRCTHNHCDLHTNTCVTEPVENCCFSDRDCRDDNKCTLNERCDLDTNTCVIEQKTCCDHNACTEDRCEPATGQCLHRSNATACDDGNPCTNDFCDRFNGCYYEDVQCHLQAGPCETATCSTVQGCVITKIDCDDDNYCTVDSCGEEGCLHEPLDCDDGNPCTDDTCDPVNKRCLHTPKQCGPEHDDCNTWTCDAVRGCVASPKICHDGNACTHGKCVEGMGCVYEEISCDDKNPCTYDYCEPGKFGGCRHDQVKHCCQLDDPCDDGNDCTEDTCVSGMCHFAKLHTPECCGDHHPGCPKKHAPPHHAFVKAEARRQIASVCGNDLVEDEEECDGSGADTLFSRCTDECVFRTAVLPIVLIVLAGLLALCAIGCCIAFACTAGRRPARRKRARN
ncbi:MAG: SdrD B-like domain-containing protein [Planctomycetota bacterium]